MAPKRTAKVLKTTKMVVEETIEVVAVGGDSQNGADVPPPGHSKVLEVVVQAEEGQVPIPVISPTPSDQRAKKDVDASEERKRERKEEEPSKEKEAEAPMEKGVAQEKADPETRKQREEEEPSKEKGAESIADKETQEEAGQGGGKDKEAEPRTPKKVEQPPQRDVEGVKEAAEAEEGRRRSQKRGRRRKKRFSRGNVGEMDGVGRGYKGYVFQVLKQVHPGLRISARAMAVLDGMMGDMFERLADEAARLSKYTGKATMSSREIEGAVKLVLPGELGKHAISEGTKAVTNYMAAARGGD